MFWVSAFWYSAELTNSLQIQIELGPSFLLVYVLREYFNKATQIHNIEVL